MATKLIQAFVPTPEYKVFQSCYEALVTAVKAQPGMFCDFLFAKGYITSSVRDYVRNDLILDEKKAQKMVDAVSDCIQVRPIVFHSFIEVLRSPHTDDVYKLLQEKYENEVILLKPLTQRSVCGGQVIPKSESSNAFLCPCGECSLEQFFSDEGCPKRSLAFFPYLDVSGLDEDTVVNLEGQLISDTLEITKVFADFTIFIRKSLQNRSVPLEDIKDTVLSLEAFGEGIGIKVLDAEDRDKVQAANSVSQVFIPLRKYMSFFNYEIVDHLVKHHGCAEDHRELQQYLDTFKIFCKRNVFHVPPEVFSSKSRTSAKLFSLKCTERISTLEGVHALKGRIAKLLGLRGTVLQLCSVRKGCIELCFIISADIAKCIFPLSDSMKSALSVINVKVISCLQNQISSEGEVHSTHTTCDQQDNYGIKETLSSPLSSCTLNNKAEVDVLSSHGSAPDELEVRLQEKISLEQSSQQGHIHSLSGMHHRLLSCPSTESSLKGRCVQTFLSPNGSKSDVHPKRIHSISTPTQTQASGSLLPEVKTEPHRRWKLTLPSLRKNRKHKTSPEPDFQQQKNVHSEARLEVNPTIASHGPSSSNLPQQQLDAHTYMPLQSELKIENQPFSAETQPPAQHHQQLVLSTSLTVSCVHPRKLNSVVPLNPEITARPKSMSRVQQPQVHSTSQAPNHLNKSSGQTFFGFSSSNSDFYSTSFCRNKTTAPKVSAISRSSSLRYSNVLSQTAALSRASSGYGSTTSNPSQPTSTSSDVSLSHFESLECVPSTEYTSALSHYSSAISRLSEDYAPPINMQYNAELSQTISQDSCNGSQDLLQSPSEYGSVSEHELDLSPRSSDYGSTASTLSQYKSALSLVSQRT